MSIETRVNEASNFSLSYSESDFSDDYLSCCYESISDFPEDEENDEDADEEISSLVEEIKIGVNDNKQKLRDGRWTQQEHFRFLIAITKVKNKWKKAQKLVSSRTYIQLRSHAQKFFIYMGKLLYPNITRYEPEHELDFKRVKKLLVGQLKAKATSPSDKKVKSSQIKGFLTVENVKKILQRVIQSRFKKQKPIIGDIHFTNLSEESLEELVQKPKTQRKKSPCKIIPALSTDSSNHSSKLQSSKKFSSSTICSEARQPHDHYKLTKGLKGETTLEQLELPVSNVLYNNTFNYCLNCSKKTLVPASNNCILDPFSIANSRSSDQTQTTHLMIDYNNIVSLSDIYKESSSNILCNVDFSFQKVQDFFQIVESEKKNSPTSILSSPLVFWESDPPQDA